MGKLNSKRSVVPPRFQHTSPDGKSNQPLSRRELEEFADEHNRFVLTTGSKSNRSQRRKWAKQKSK